MRIAVIGAGGIGAIYGAALAKAGVEVTFVARGAHLRAMQQNGLTIEGDRGETLVRPAHAVDDIAAIDASGGPIDYALLCVKLWDVESAASRLRPIVGAGAAVVTLQNGVSAHEPLLAMLGRSAVMPGTAFVTGSIVAPGVVRQTGTYMRMSFGELDGTPSRRGEALRDACAAAGIEGIFSPDVMVPIWEKFLVLVPLANVNALTRLPLGRYRADPDTWALVEKSLYETAAVGRAEGVRLPPDAEAQGVAMLRSMPDHHMTSMGNDLLRGGRLELPWFAGKVGELGRRHGIPTPVNDFVYAALKLHAAGAPAAAGPG
ncbi:MAG TPA: 2-dehydropantoate 2-reductase [Stellaceae bacterium]|nr:2-dehydropantoate 2-reductase [Stellaceae bacterium]